MFFLPIGHDQTQVRRFPVFSAALVVLCTLCFVIAEHGRLERLAEVERTATAMIAYAEEHDVTFPPGVPSLMEYRTSPGTRRQREADYRVALETSRSDERDAEQRAFEEICARFVAAQDARLDRRFGLVSGDIEPYALLTHMFMHGGWGHLIGNMLFLFLAGFALEELWGRGAFTALYLASGLAAAGLQYVTDPHVQIPMVGASGAVAGLMGAFMIRLWHSRIRFFYLFWFGRFFFGTIPLPAWLMLPLWFASESMSALAGGFTGVAHWAHVGGFAFGAVAAVGMALTGIERRILAPRIDAKLTFVKNTAIDRATKLEQSGRSLEAFELLRDEVKKNPDNHDAVLAFWDTAVRVDRAPHAALELAKAIERSVKHARFEDAIADLAELEKHAPGTRMSVTVLIQLAAGLSTPGTFDEAVFSLEKAIRDCGGTPHPALALRLGRAALVPRASLAAKLAREALASPALEPRLRPELETLLDEAIAAAPQGGFTEEAQGAHAERHEGVILLDDDGPDLAGDVPSAAAANGPTGPSSAAPSKRAQEFGAFDTGPVDLSAGSDDPEIQTALAQELGEPAEGPDATPFELQSTFDLSGGDDDVAIDLAQGDAEPAPVEPVGLDLGSDDDSDLELD